MNGVTYFEQLLFLWFTKKKLAENVGEKWNLLSF